MNKYLRIVLSELLHVFGALWLSVEIFSFFGNDKLSIKIKSLWWFFLIIGIIIILFKSLPKKKFIFPISDRDCRVEVIIGDLFKQEGSIIVGSNTSFEVDPKIISPKSIQGQFCEKYYKDTAALKTLIESKFTTFPVDFGTTIKVKGTGKTGYFCAIAELTNSKAAKSNMQNLLISLGALWNYLSLNSEKEIINIPIIGSGFSRIKEKREIIAKEIIRSFLAGISDHCFSDCVRIIISPRDIKNHTFNLEEFLDFIGYATKFALLKSSSPGAGQEISI